MPTLPIADLLTPALEGKLADLLSIDRSLLLVETRRFVQLAHEHGIGIVDLDRQRCLVDERVYESVLYRGRIGRLFVTQRHPSPEVWRDLKII